jgi:hypothetical protein
MTKTITTSTAHDARELAEVLADFLALAKDDQPDITLSEFAFVEGGAFVPCLRLSLQRETLTDGSVVFNIAL